RTTSCWTTPMWSTPATASRSTAWTPKSGCRPWADPDTRDRRTQEGGRTLSNEAFSKKVAGFGIIGAFVAGSVIFSGGGGGAPGECLAAINAAESSFAVAAKAFNESGEIVKAAGRQDTVSMLKGNKAMNELFPRYRAALDSFKQYSGECRE